MNTQQLETFVTAAENLNFARTAELLNITQSAVSRQIRSLEDELNTKLLLRTTRTVVLTPAGLSFLEDAKHILKRLKFAEEKIQHNTGSRMQILSIGCRNEMDVGFLYPILTACREKLPFLHPFIRVIPYPSLLNLFYQDEIDVLFGFKDNILAKGDVIFRELFRVPLCCILHKSHPYAQNSEIHEQELSSENLVTCNSYAIPENAARQQSHMLKHLLPESVYPCDSMQSSLALVRAGYGYTILPESKIKDELLQYIPIKNSKPMLYGIFYKKKSSHPLLKNFISLVNTTVDSQEMKN